jgi:hypothetical protein
VIYRAILGSCLAALLALPSMAEPIKRDRAQVRAFRAENPCPSTRRIRGACPGFQVDHSKPLCAAGSDTPDNMAWLSIEDHKWKTFVDLRECRRFRRAAAMPAREPQ